MRTRPVFLGLIFPVVMCLCALSWPRTASAHPADIVTLPINATWTAVSCHIDPEDQDFCSGTGGSFVMDVTFLLDPDTMSVSQLPTNSPIIFFRPSASMETSGQGQDIYNFSFDLSLGAPGGAFGISYYGGTWQVVPGSIGGRLSQDFVFLDFDDDGFGHEVGLFAA